MGKCHEEDKECNWLCGAYCGKEIPYGFGRTGHCLKLAGPHMIAASIYSFTKEVQELRTTLNVMEISLRSIGILEV